MKQEKEFSEQIKVVKKGVVTHIVIQMVVVVVLAIILLITK